MIRSPLEESLEEWERLMDLCRAAAESGVGEIPDNKDVVADIAKNKKHMALAISMMGKIAQMK